MPRKPQPKRGPGRPTKYREPMETRSVAMPVSWWARLEARAIAASKPGAMVSVADIIRSAVDVPGVRR